MTREQYMVEIRRACQSLGVYRVEFSRTRCRLAEIYVRIEELNRGLKNGEFFTTCISHSRNGDVEVVDPHIQELDRLNDQALTYEKALGLTADSVRKINEEAFAPKKESDPIAAALKNAGIVMMNE